MSSRSILCGVSMGVIGALLIFGGGCGGSAHDVAPDSGALPEGGGVVVDGGVVADGGLGGAGAVGGSQSDSPAGPAEGGSGEAGQGPPPANSTTVSKIDILFDIDNSSSMGDKQQYLQQAIPDLIQRLTTPNCVDAAGNNLTGANGLQLVAAADGTCTMGQPQFAPVTDMHIGVVTSGLGGRGTTTICQVPTTPNAVEADYLEFTSGSYQQYLLDAANNDYTGLTSVSKNNDDQAHLINRTAPPATPNVSPGQLPGDFLAWAPTATGDASGADAEPTTTQLETDTQDVIIGAGAFGCGIESQLESWYR